MRDNYNSNTPLVMHVDLNSAFATIEQQSRPRLRGRPVAVVNRRTEHTSVITASYEAKSVGVKVGMPLREAKYLCSDIVVVESDPIKYRFVYKKLLKILSDYSPNAIMKSIDEGVMSFENLAIKRPLIDVGLEIKQRLKNEVGNVMRCNVGIGTNRFLAKTAAGLHKPDGLDEINSDNLREVYKKLKLQDLTGIAYRYGARLEAVGITTPLEFLDCDVVTLEKIVFKGIVGRQWYERLRGWEVDDRVFQMGRIGRQYVLESRTLSRQEILIRLHYLCETVGERLRKQAYGARGIYIYVRTAEHKYWHASKLLPLPFFSNQAIYSLAKKLFFKSPPEIREIGIHCYYLIYSPSPQMSFFGDQLARQSRIYTAVDDINNRYGDRTVHSADTLTAGPHIRQKVSFGSTRYF